jgi:hypothetical protein
VCAPAPVKLRVTNPATCEAEISPAALLKLVSFGNTVTGFLDAGRALSPSSTVYTLQPPPSPGASSYVFAGGQRATVQLTATTRTVSVDSCLTTVVVDPLTPPTAVCAPTLTLPATSGCAAHPTIAQLKAGIDAGSSPGSGGTLAVTLSPAAPAGGVYTLPVGTYPVTLTVANCAGASTCSTLVTVADQEPLDVRAPLRAPAAVTPCHSMLQNNGGHGLVVIALPSEQNSATRSNAQDCVVMQLTSWAVSGLLVQRPKGPNHADRPQMHACTRGSR